MTPHTDKALAFLDGTGTDHLGRNINDYLKFSPNDWEACHNHIQWAFPSDQASNFNPNAPVIEDMEKFVERMSATVTNNIGAMLIQYTANIGLMGYLGNEPQVWLTPNNHNFLRLTRILNLLYYMCEESAKLLYFKLIRVAKDQECVTKETLMYWSLAATGNLNLKIDGIH